MTSQATAVSCSEPVTSGSSSDSEDNGEMSLSSASSSETSNMTSMSGSSSSGEEQCTPPKTRARNMILQQLRASQLANSPALKIPATPIMERLGYGTGVGVFLLERSPRLSCVRSPWAIKKTIKVADYNELFAERLEYEAEILKQLSHPNIIGYRAFGIPTPDSAFLAMERASKSLADLIEDRVNQVLLIEDCDKGTPFPASNMEKVALDMAQALTYLHDDKRMIHGDLKSANVLVFGDFETIKLCDFGVARKIAADGTLTGNYVGTEIWNPMEVVLAKRGQNSEPITYKADIFPFGLTIHEMITLRPPHLSSAEDSYICGSSDFNEALETSTGEDETTEVNFDEEAYEKALARHVGTRPSLPEMDFDDSYNTILGVFYCCTDEEATKRPDAKVIVEALKADVQTEIKIEMVK